MWKGRCGIALSFLRPAVMSENRQTLALSCSEAMLPTSSLATYPPGEECITQVLGHTLIALILGFPSLRFVHL